MKAKPDIHVTVEIGHGQPTKAQLAAWRQAWKLLAAMPAPTPAAGGVEAREMHER